MAGTLADMKARISDELARGDLASQIALAINDAIVAYQDERFMFNESRNVTFNTVINQEFYGVLDNPLIGTINKLDYIFLYVNNTPFKLDPSTPETMEWLANNSTFVGQPYDYVWYQSQIRLYPVPVAVYPVRIACSLQQPAPATDGETNNPWMIIAERLIRSRAKFELAIHVLKDEQLAADMDKVLTEAFKQLKNRTNVLTKMGAGFVRPMAF